MQHSLTQQQSRLLPLALLLPVLLAFGVGYLAFENAALLARSSEGIIQAEEETRKIQDLIISLRDTEGELRDSLLLNEPESTLNPDKLNTLRVQVKELPKGAFSPQSLAAFIHQTEELLERLEVSQNLSQQNRSAEALALLVSTPSRLKFEQIRSLADGLVKEKEAASIRLRSQATHQAGLNWKLSLFMMLAQVLAVVSLAIGLFGRRKGIVTVCAWTNAVRYKGNWVSFDEFLRRRFNLQISHGISDEACVRLNSAPPPETLEASLIKPD